MNTKHECTCPKCSNIDSKPNAQYFFFKFICIAKSMLFDYILLFKQNTISSTENSNEKKHPQPVYKLNMQHLLSILFQPLHQNPLNPELKRHSHASHEHYTTSHTVDKIKTWIFRTTRDPSKSPANSFRFEVSRQPIRSMNTSA